MMRAGAIAAIVVATAAHAFAQPAAPAAAPPPREPPADDPPVAGPPPAPAPVAAGAGATGEVGVQPAPPLIDSLELTLAYVGLRRTFEERPSPDVAQGAGFFVGGRFARHLIGEMQLMLAWTDIEGERLLTTRAGVGVRAFAVPFDGVRVHAAAAIGYAGYSIGGEPDHRQVVGGLVEAGGGVVIRIAHAFTCSDFGVIVDVREQLAYTDHGGVAHGLTWIVGVGGFPVATLERGAPATSCRAAAR